MCFGWFYCNSKEVQVYEIKYALLTRFSIIKSHFLCKTN